jgi:hypothetical protein
MLIWPFKTRGARSGLPAPVPSGLPRKAEFTDNDLEVKVWLPQQIIERLNWLSAQSDLSRADVIRVLTFKHLYGEIGYEALVPTPVRESDTVTAAALRKAATSAVPSFFPQPVEAEEITRSARRDHSIDIEHLGPSTNNEPINLPRRMVADVERLALIEGLSRSQCMRKLLVLHLMGAIHHANWQKALGPMGADVARLDSENDAE